MIGRIDHTRLSRSTLSIVFVIFSMKIIDLHRFLAGILSKTDVFVKYILKMRLCASHRLWKTTHRKVLARNQRLVVQPKTRFRSSSPIAFARNQSTKALLLAVELNLSTPEQQSTALQHHRLGCAKRWHFPLLSQHLHQVSVLLLSYRCWPYSTGRRRQRGATILVSKAANLPLL